MQDLRPELSDLLDQHAYRLERLENQRRRRRWIYLLAGGFLMLCMGASYLYLSGFLHPVKTYVVFPAEQYDRLAVRESLSRGEGAIILADFDSGRRDTLFSLTALEAWIEKYGAAYSFLAAEQSGEDTAVPNTQTSPTTQKTPSLQRKISTASVPRHVNVPRPVKASYKEITCSLKIFGERKVGKRLVFVVRNYDKGLSYELNFDNGYIANVREKSVYAYKRPGRYQVALTATASDGRTHTHQLVLDVAEDEEVISKDVPARRKYPNQQEDLSKGKSQSQAYASQPQRKISVDTVSFSSRQKAKEKAINSQAVAANISNPSSRPPVRQAYSGPREIAQQMPSFPGGEAALLAFIRKHLEYPPKALKNDIQGRIYVQFVVQADGSLTDLRVVRGIGYGCDQEAIRMIKSMPKWVPGSNDGQRIPVYYTLPITFELR